MVRSYCTQNNGDCSSCSLVNYGMDCKNNPIVNADQSDLYWIATEYISECCGKLLDRAWDKDQQVWVWECSGCDTRVKSPVKGRPQEMQGGKRRNVYLDDASWDKAVTLGNGNASDGIRIALSRAGVDG